MKKVRLTFLGDLLCLKEQIRLIARYNHSNYDCVFQEVRPILQGYVIANLETPVAGQKLRLSYETMRFNAPEQFLESVKNAGIGHVSLANNHILDRGLEGLFATISNCNKNGLDYSGAFEHYDDYDKIFIKDLYGIKFAFISCTYGTNQGLKNSLLKDDDLWHVEILKYPVQTKASTTRRFVSNLIPDRFKNLIKMIRKKDACPIPDCVSIEEYGKNKNQFFFNKVLKKIQRAKELADVVIVLAHMGGQFSLHPGEWQKKVTEDFVNAGADLVIGNHNHAPLEVKKVVDESGTIKGVVSYALGDFCASPIIGFTNSKCQSDYSIVLHCDFDVETKSVVAVDYDVCRSVPNEHGIYVVRCCDKGDASDQNVQDVIKRVSRGK